MGLLEHLKNNYSQNEPIYADEIRFGDYSGERIAEALESLAVRREIKLFDTGIYYFPTKLFFGDSRLNPLKVIERRYLTNGVEVYGYTSGLSLQNLAGLSTQVPNVIELTTDKGNGVVEITVGGQKVITYKSPTKITRENANTLQFLDLMTHAVPSDIGETESFLLKNFTKNKKISRSDINKYAGFFPKEAMINIRESKIENEFTQ